MATQEHMDEAGPEARSLATGKWEEPVVVVSEFMTDVNRARADLANRVDRLRLRASRRRSGN